MESALYFPFTEPHREEQFLKNALFLWNSVDFIVPYRDFSTHQSDNEMAEAFEIIRHNYVPTDKDKQRIHAELVDFCNGAVPDSLIFKPKEVRPYGFYPQKLLPETWDLLANSNLAKIAAKDGEVTSAETTALFGYYMMSVVAVCCANGRKRLVTDDNDPYRTLANILTDTPSTSDVVDDSWHGRLVAMTLGAPDLTEVPLQRLLALRKRDEQLLISMRRTFAGALDKAVLDISKNAGNPNIARDVVKEFTHSMERDLRDLKVALGRSAASAILSPEGGVTVLSAIAAVATAQPLAGIVTLGGLFKSLNNYQDRRRKILSEHPSAWLYEVSTPFKLY